MVKKLIASILSAAMLVTSSLPTNFFYGRESTSAPASAPVRTNEAQIAGSNSLGELISESQNDQNYGRTNLSAKAAEKVFSITAFSYDTGTGKISILSTQSEACDAVISFIPDGSDKPVYTVTEHLSAGELVPTQTYAALIRLPEYYKVEAQLVSSKGKALCTPYVVTQYTEKIQNVIKTDIHAFEPDRVVNLDDNEQTNFIVLSEDTIMAESSETENTLVSADYDNKVFVFEDPDEIIRGLEEGDKFYIQPTEDDIIAVNVDSVVLDGNTATINGSGNASDVCDFIKIDVKNGLDGATLDATNASEELDFSEISGGEKVFTITGNKPISFRSDMKKEKIASLPLTFPRGEFVEGSINFDFDLSFYYFFTEVDLALKIDVDIKIGLKFEMSLDSDENLNLSWIDKLNQKMEKKNLEFIFPSVLVPMGAGTCITFTPSILLEAKGSLNVMVHYSPSFLIAYSDDEGLMHSSEVGTDRCDVTFSLEGSVALKLVLSPKLTAIEDHIASASLKLYAGVQADMASSGSIRDIDDYFGAVRTNDGKVMLVLPDKKDESSIHDCTIAFTGQLSIIFGLEFDAIILGLPLEGISEEVQLPIPGSEFYLDYYNDSPHFGLGECPNKKYRVKIKVTDQYDNDLTEALVRVNNMPQLNTDGEVVYHCSDGRYNMTVTYDTYVYTNVVEVKQSEQNITVKLHITNDSNGINYRFDSRADVTGVKQTAASTTKRPACTTVTLAARVAEGHNDVERIQLGENIWGHLYANGVLYVFGYGDMSNFTSSPFKNIKDAKSVYIHNNHEEDELYITSIGNHVFDGAELVEAVYLPNTIKTIGDHAFNNMKNLKYFRYDGPEDNKTGFDLPGDITYLGKYAFAGCSSITSVVVPDQVTAVGENCFERCTSLKTAYIGNVGKIGQRTFHMCTSLQKLTLPYAGLSPEDIEAGKNNLSFFLFNGSYCDGVYALGGSYQYAAPETLTEIVITGGDRVPNNAFYGMKSLTKVTLPDSVKVIGHYAFWNCTGIKEIKLPAELETIGVLSFYNTGLVKLDADFFPPELTAIGNSAFCNCENLTFAEMPGTVRTIGNNVFNNCKSLKEAIIGDIDSMGDRVFSQCTKLEKLTLPYAALSKEMKSSMSLNMFDGSYGDGLYALGGGYQYAAPESLKEIVITGGDTIPYNAFYGMSRLTKITLPDSIKTIDNYAFYNCSGIKEIELPEGLESIGAFSFYNTSLTELNADFFPSTLTSIGRDAFNNCTKLTFVEIPDTVRTMGNNLFYNCTSLKEAVIGNVDSMGERIFTNCFSLAKLTLPYASVNKDMKNCMSTLLFNANTADGLYSVSGYYSAPETLTEIVITGGDTIPYNAFYGMSRVTKITLPETLKNIGNYAFYNCTGLTDVYIEQSEEEWNENAVIGAFNEPFGSAAKHFRVYAAITKQPSDVLVMEGEKASASVSAVGDGLKYEWWFKEKGSSKFYKSSITTKTYSVEMNEARSGRRLFCVVSDKYGHRVQSDIITITMKVPAEITVQPESVSVKNGEMASVSVAAKGDELTYAWYFKEPGGTKYYKSGITTNTYSVAMNEARNGRRLFCIVTDKYGNKVQTVTAIITMKNTAAISAQPENVSAKNGETASVSVKATGDGLTYTWWFREKGGSTFYKSGTKTNTYSVAMNDSRDGRQLYCVVADKYGNTVKSDTVTITMIGDPVFITVQPESIAVKNGETASVSVTAKGDGLKYEWWFSEKGSDKFYKSSISTGVYSVEMNSSRDGRRLYCIITDRYGNKVQSETVTITARITEAVIIGQPENALVENIGDTATVTVNAAGEGLTYTWYIKNSGSDKFVKSGIKSASYSVEMTETRHGRKLYCVVGDSYGNEVVSDTVVMGLSGRIILVDEPEDAAVNSGETAEVKVSAAGDGLTYEWWFSDNGSDKFYKSSITGDTYAVAMNSARNGRKLYCIITNSSGETVRTNTVTITMT